MNQSLTFPTLTATLLTVTLIMLSSCSQEQTKQQTPAPSIPASTEAPEQKKFEQKRAIEEKKEDTHSAPRDATTPQEKSFTTHDAKTDDATKQHASSNVVELKNNFDDIVLKSLKPVVVDFHAPWCPACIMMHPVFEHMAQKYPHVTFVSVNIDTNNDIAQKYNIGAIPTFIFFKEGAVVDTKQGVLSEQEFSTVLTKLFPH